MMTLKKSVNVLFLLIILILLPGMAGRVMAQFQDWSEPDKLPTESGSYRLTRDVTVNSIWGNNGTEVILDLNGHTVTYTGDRDISIVLSGDLQITDSTGGGKFVLIDKKFIISTGNLTLKDAVIQGDVELYSPLGDSFFQIDGGTLKGQVLVERAGTFFGRFSSVVNFISGTIQCTNISCVELNSETGTFNMSGGTIQSNESSRTVFILSGTFRLSGGEIKLLKNHPTGSEGVVLGDSTTAGGSFIMEGGSITGFTGLPRWESAYAVHFYNGGSVTMTGGEISGNRIAVQISNGGSLTMTGGEISGNDIAVRIGNGSSLTMTGGSITANSTGVSCMQNSTLNLSGSPKITGNSSKNVLMNAEIQKINITGGGLNSDARVGITSKKLGTEEMVSGVITAGLNGNYIPGVFSSDVSGYFAGRQSDQGVPSGSRG